MKSCHACGRPFAPKASEQVASLVARAAADHGVTEAQIMGRSLNAKVVTARYQAIRFASGCLGISNADLGRIFGRDHGTITYALSGKKRRAAIVRAK